MSDYPGLGLPLRHNPQRNYGFYPIGAHGSCSGADSDILPIREIAMLSIMDRLTDKPDWEKKVFDEEIVSKWREEALAIPDKEFNNLARSDKSQWWDENGNLTIRDDHNFDEELLEGVMTANTFHYCIRELRNKAKYYEKSGIIPTLDACASVAKSDRLVPAELKKDLRNAFSTLTKAQESSAPDWHPNSNDQVRDLVHPSMYPLVYGRSRVLKDEVVGISDAISKWAGKGNIITKDEWQPGQDERFRYGVGGGDVPPQYWSSTYQWLPANVAFQKDGSVKFTSFINNLHPNKYPEIYQTIEKLIETALPALDQCMALAASYNHKEGAGRVESRFPYPDSADDEEPENWSPSDPEACADREVDWEALKNKRPYYNPEYDDENIKKWELFRKPVIPEPEFEDIDYAPQPGTSLAEKFKESGLQIIVKMASIELTPEKPEFPAGGWHIEGQMNEHIAATALYYLDSENITSSSLSFRMQTSAYLNDDISVGQDAYHWLEKVYGTNLGGGSSPCLQNYGSVETKEGRLLAFPNVFQHRVSSFRLKDPTKPGFRRFIALWVVDPTKRIISTANVPPQQFDWWLDSVLGDATNVRNEALSKIPAELVALMEEKRASASNPSSSSAAEASAGTAAETSLTGAETSHLPPELMEMVRSHFNVDGEALPMGLKEAKEHRLKLMAERSAHVREAEKGWQQHSYSFCEH